MSDPMAIADVSRRSLKHKADQEQRSSLGQFFTPPIIARLMASMSTLSRDRLRVLDPGAGAGALTAAWVAEVCSRVQRPHELTLVAVEIDESLHPQLEQTLKACERSCTAVGIRCRWGDSP